jgi:hypothetical protein
MSKNGRILPATAMRLFPSERMVLDIEYIKLAAFFLPTSILDTNLLVKGLINGF